MLNVILYRNNKNQKWVHFEDVLVIQKLFIGLCKWCQ